MAKGSRFADGVDETISQHRAVQRLDLALVRQRCGISRMGVRELVGPPLVWSRHVSPK
jgi:hypothetical protein